MKHITMEDWKKVQYLIKTMKVGDSVDNKIIHRILSTSFPVFHSKECLQINEVQGEIYDAETNTMKPTYVTFSKKNGQWIYCGCCFQGKNTEPTLTL